MNFPTPEKTFYFDLTTELGNRYEGQFTVKCLLSIGEKHRLELEKSRLLGSAANPTDDLIGLAIVLANLRHKIVDAPNWWKQSKNGEDIKEEQVVARLYGEIQKAEDEWKSELMEKAKKAKETTSLQA